MILENIFTLESLAALATLTLLEVVLGIDNIVFITILVSRLEKSQQAMARKIGLALAMLMRIGLLLSLSWVMRLSEPLFSLLGHGISGRDLTLLVGGMFLLVKSTLEIHKNIEGEEEHSANGARKAFWSVIVQIMLLDIIFSLDSVITAVGMANQLSIMIAAVVIAVFVMMMFAGPVGDFVTEHPTVKMLALSFLILIGMALVADGMHIHIPKGYIYFSIAFSLFVEFLNLKMRKSRVIG
ncbi:MAG: TerC family protein [bacterium]|nr:TerC family protein [bacterium]